MRLTFKFYSWKKYWSIKNKFRLISFQFKRRRFLFKKFIISQKFDSKTIYNQIRQSFWIILRTLGFIVFLFFIEQLLSNYWISNLDTIPKWLVQLQEKIPKPTYPNDKEPITELISVIASISGVILALFYPVLATIASTAYAKVHFSIRNLLLFEKETQSFLKQLTTLTATSITILMFLSFGILPGNLVIIFLAIFSLITLFGVLKIGLGVYNFFEPSTLSGIAYDKLKTAIINVTTDGEYWNDDKFQRHNYFVAQEQTENLVLISNLCIKDDSLKESSFKSTFQISLSILEFYLTNKSKIPIDSDWYPNIYKHISYFESDITTRSYLGSSSYFIQPSIYRNQFWFEERMISNLSTGLESVIKSGYHNILSESILLTYRTFDVLGQTADLKTGQFLLDKLLENIKLLCNTNVQDRLSNNYDDWRDELSGLETYCHAISRLQLGIIKTVTSFNSTKIISEFNKIVWKTKSSIYSTNLLPALSDQLYKYKIFVENEIAIEGKQITPNTYFRQQFTSQHLKFITETINRTVTLFDSHLLSLTKEFEANHNYLLASFTSQTGLSIIKSVSYNIDILKLSLEDIDKLEVFVGEFEWKKPNIDEIKKKLAHFEDAFSLTIAKNIEQLTLMNWTNRFPDLFANSYFILLKKIDDCFKNNTIERFKMFFSPFLISSIKAFSKLNITFNYYNEPSRISYQALLEPMEISGYSYAYSVIYNKPEYWEEVCKAWNENFDATRQNIEVMVKYYNYHKRNLNGIGINFVNTHARKIIFSEVIDRLNITPENINDTLVKFFVSRNNLIYSNYNIEELFIELYLFTFIDAKSSTELISRDLFDDWCTTINNTHNGES